ncbi:adenosylcobinamide-GDP ribazoletransferase [Paracoccaceae bacterium]|nr:adenosylcobinamide-GDP ribazoletransferase [Paracoccaceae bacterium]
MSHIIKKTLEDIAIAMIVLTQFPVDKVIKFDKKIDISRGQWAYTIVGALIGTLLFISIVTFELLGLSFSASILISMAFGFLLTGAIHEDGVADFFDSLGARDYSERQKILKDSRLGTFGVLSLVTAILMKFFLISELSTYFALAVGLIASSSLSRFLILILVNHCEISKQGGLVNDLKKLDTKTLSLSGILPLLCLAAAGIGAVITMTTVGFIVVYLFKKHLTPLNKGLSGDMLGLGIVLVEILTLAVVSISFS